VERKLRNEETFEKIRDYLNDIESLLAW
jgi:hypothetical protein